MVEDAISYLQIGIDHNRDFYSINFNQLELSYMDDYPQNYKVVGTSIYRDLNLHEIHRTTYDTLNFLGDLGGLLDFLMLVGVFLTKWFARFTFTKYVTDILYKQRAL
jgi:hypothetical protein